MCGITGVINFDESPVERHILKNMTDALAHRGPDGEGHWIEGGVGIGHRRLAILDKSEAGSQPMLSPDSRFVLTFNGEIYNFLDLRLELEKNGFTFRSACDSEVLLYALIYWGPSAVPKLNGMFAFALWDRLEKTLFLARDRYGIKPLYIAKQGSSIWFASEQKAVLADERFKRALDTSALIEYFTFQNIFSGRTFMQDISLLEPGSYMTIGLGGRSPKINSTRYWNYNFSEPERPDSKQDYVEELDRLFQQAVNRQLIGDVEIGSYLSGGIDSGSITAIAAQAIPNIKTFTCGFDLTSASILELNFDERLEAEHMSFCFKTEHYQVVLKAGDMERAMPKLGWHMEEPRVGQSYGNYYASNLASKFVKVVLSGTGGDELFGGYPWRYYNSSTKDDFEQFSRNYYKVWQRLIPAEMMPEMFSPVWKDVSKESTFEIFQNVFGSCRKDPLSQSDYLNLSLNFEAKTFLSGLLVMEDKLSMAHGLETRVPFLDNDLVDFAMKCPSELMVKNHGSVPRVDENTPGRKTSDYFNRTRNGKLILRESMGRHLPDKISSRLKQGFSGPDASWFKGESSNYINRRLGNADAAIYDYLNPASVRSLIREHTSGKANRRLLIWSLLSFDQWLENFL